MKAIAKAQGGSVINRDNTDIDATVTVCCAARLHLGFFDLEGGIGRRFGSIGLSLDQPATRLTARHADETRVSGAEQDRVARYLAAMRAHLGLSGHYADRHRAGDAVARRPRFGHAIGAGRGGGAAPPGGASGRSARRCATPGTRRAVGHRHRPVQPGRPCRRWRQGARAPNRRRCWCAWTCREAWRVLLVLDRDRAGLSGPRERSAFDALAPMDPAVSGAICRLVLMQALPAMAEQDLAGFGCRDHRDPEPCRRLFRAEPGRPFHQSAGGRCHARAGAGGRDRHRPEFMGADRVRVCRQRRVKPSRLALNLQQRGMMKRLDLLVCRVLNRGASVTVA